MQYYIRLPDIEEHEKHVMGEVWLFFDACNLYLTQLMFLISCNTVSVWLAEALLLWAVANLIKNFGNTGIFSFPFRHTAVCFKGYPAMKLEFP